MDNVQDGKQKVKTAADVIWPKKRPFTVRGNVTFAVTVTAEDARQALAYVGELVDGLQNEVQGYYNVNSINEWEVDAENVRSE